MSYWKPTWTDRMCIHLMYCQHYTNSATQSGQGALVPCWIRTHCLLTATRSNDQAISSYWFMQKKTVYELSYFTTWKSGALFLRARFSFSYCSIHISRSRQDTTKFLTVSASKPLSDVYGRIGHSLELKYTQLLLQAYWAYCWLQKNEKMWTWNLGHIFKNQLNHHMVIFSFTGPYCKIFSLQTFFAWFSSKRSLIYVIEVRSQNLKCWKYLPSHEQIMYCWSVIWLMTIFKQQSTTGYY